MIRLFELEFLSIMLVQYLPALAWVCEEVNYSQ